MSEEQIYLCDKKVIINCKKYELNKKYNAVKPSGRLLRTPSTGVHAIELPRFSQLNDLHITITSEMLYNNIVYTGKHLTWQHSTTKPLRWCRWLSGKALNLHSFKSWVRVSQCYVPLSPSSITWYRSKMVTFFGSKGDRRPGGK